MSDKNKQTKCHSPLWTSDLYTGWNFSSIEDWSIHDHQIQIAKTGRKWKRKTSHQNRCQRRFIKRLWWRYLIPSNRGHATVCFDKYKWREMPRTDQSCGGQLVRVVLVGQIVLHYGRQWGTFDTKTTYCCFCQFIANLSPLQHDRLTLM